MILRVSYLFESFGALPPKIITHVTSLPRRVICDSALRGMGACWAWMQLIFNCPYQRLPYFPGDTDSSDPFIMTNTTENIPIDTGIYNIALQTSGLTIGPMPVQSFLDKFLQNSNARRPATRNRKGICSRLPVKKTPGALVSQYSSFLSCPSNTRLD